MLLEALQPLANVGLKTRIELHLFYRLVAIMQRSKKWRCITSRSTFFKVAYEYLRVLSLKIVRAMLPLLFLHLLAVVNGNKQNVTAEIKSNTYGLVLTIRYPVNLSEGNMQCAFFLWELVIDLLAWFWYTAAKHNHIW